MTDEAGNEAQVVLADAQFGVSRIMRPYSGFEDVYQGTPAYEPVYLFPEGKAIDPIAEGGTPGYDPLLARGLPVPYGSRLSLKIPNVFYSSGNGTAGYVYAFIWRLRNVFDFRQLRIPFHFPRSSGVSDTTAPAGSQRRVPLPASYNSITFVQTEPTTGLARSVANIRSDDLRAATTPLALPKLPGGRVQPIQQGILDPASVSDANKPTNIDHEVQSLGDEVLIAVYRPTGELEDNWDFGAGQRDYRFSQFYGSATGQELPNVGVQVLPGAAP